MTVNVPKRMPLLRPIQSPAIGYAREALHSIVKRVCEKNRLSVSTVVSGVLAPLFKRKSSSIRLANNSMHLISKGEGISSQWIEVLRETVDIPDFWNHTLRDVASLNGVGIANCSHWRRWCPSCFEEDLDTNLGPYDRLLWSIEEVKVCEQHKTLLESSCANCGLSKIPVLTGRDISGFCPRCQGWLGGRGVPLPSEQDQYVNFLMWTARSFSDLLDATSLPLEVSGNILKMLKRLRDRHCSGLNVGLAKVLGRNKSVVTTWLTGKANPSWRALCEISFTFHVPLTDLLRAEIAAIEFSVVRNLPLQAATRTNRKRAEKRDLNHIRTFYTAVENQTVVAHTMTDVGRGLNITSKGLRQLLPKETIALSALLKERRELTRDRKVVIRVETLAREIDVLVAAMTSRREKLTRRAIYKALRLSGLTVRGGEHRLVSQLVKETARKLAN